MQILTTITQKGQITVPLVFRKKLGLSKFGRVIIQAKSDRITIKPAEDILDLAGTLVPKHKKPILKARAQMEKSYRGV